jgi:GNAT superfamily N-acetyltransferase
MATWRQLTSSDIDAVVRVMSVIHAALPESREVFAERVRLFPEGCLALVNEAGELNGYAISHPIRYRQPPELDGLLQNIAPDADQYYLHDVCVLPAYRGQGLAAQAIEKLLAIAERFPSACLISVYGTVPFWGRHGFLTPPSVETVLAKKLLNYGAEATFLERQKVQA